MHRHPDCSRSFDSVLPLRHERANFNTLRQIMAPSPFDDDASCVMRTISKGISIGRESNVVLLDSRSLFWKEIYLFRLVCGLVELLRRMGFFHRQSMISVDCIVSSASGPIDSSFQPGRLLERST